MSLVDEINDIDSSDDKVDLPKVTWAWMRESNGTSWRGRRRLRSWDDGCYLPLFDGKHWTAYTEKPQGSWALVIKNPIMRSGDLYQFETRRGWMVQIGRGKQEDMPFFTTRREAGDYLASLYVACNGGNPNDYDYLNL